MTGASGPAGLAAVGPEAAEPPEREVPPPATVPAPAAVPPVTEVALPAAPPPTLPVTEEPPGAGCAPPFCGTVDTAPCCDCDCCCATPVGSGPPLTAERMASWGRRLPPQALTAIAGRIAIVHHHREPGRA